MDATDALEALQKALPRLQARNIERLRVEGCTASVAPPLPALLARTLFPGLRRWVLMKR